MKSVLILAFLTITLHSCKKEGIEGKKSLVDFIAESKGINCTSGGYKIISGVDLNSNNILDDPEIQSTEYICNGNDGNDGMTSLINVLTEPAGEFCENGGLKIENGIDLNANGLLDSEEIQTISYTCNGLNGASNGAVSVIRLPFEVLYEWRQATGIWQSNYADAFISDFNIANYPGFNKAYFIAEFRKQPATSTDSLGLRLYDYTNKKGILNSELWSLIPDPESGGDPINRIFKSHNFLNSFSNENIQIGFQYRCNSVEPMGLSVLSAEIRLTIENE